MSILQVFGEVLGLCNNTQKSSVFPIRCSDSEKWRCSDGALVLTLRLAGVSVSVLETTSLLYEAHQRPATTLH
jgi:hypothetical protein